MQGNSRGCKANEISSKNRSRRRIHPLIKARLREFGGKGKKSIYRRIPSTPAGREVY